MGGVFRAEFIKPEFSASQTRTSSNGLLTTRHDPVT